MNRISAIICLILSLSIGGCATTGGKTSAEKRQSILYMKNEVLSNSDYIKIGKSAVNLACWVGVVLEN